MRVPTCDSSSAPVRNPQHALTINRHPIRKTEFLRYVNDTCPILYRTCRQIKIKPVNRTCRGINVIHVLPIWTPAQAVGCRHTLYHCANGLPLLQTIQRSGFAFIIHAHRACPEAALRITFAIIKTIGILILFGVLNGMTRTRKQVISVESTA
ncbi:hypothetical protein D3C76_1260000 [compost metagenome]